MLTLIVTLPVPLTTLTITVPLEPAKTASAVTVMITLGLLFSTTLAPLAGVYGYKLGILAGMLHFILATNVGIIHGGINLYNNGFSCGWVAIIMVPFVESFYKRFEIRKKNKGGTGK